MFRTRRSIILACGTFFLSRALIFGKQVRTPWQGEGPFYPDKFPKDIDSDLVKNGESTVQAGGEILNLDGILLDIHNRPYEGVIVEIWQTDMNGVYLHGHSFGIKSRDKKFQGFGRSITTKEGYFSFRTIVPANYPGRTPHIHLKLFRKKLNILTTQLYIHEHPLNENDFLFRNMTNSEKKLNSMKLVPVVKKNIIEYNTKVKLVV